MKRKLLPFIAILNCYFCATSSGQIVMLGSFNPAGAVSLCGIGYDPDSSHVWIYGCNDNSIQCYSDSGVLLNSFAEPGGSANDVDIEITPEQLFINGNSIPQGQLLFINGETGTTEIYAVDNTTGAVIDTLATAFGADHVVGGAYHTQRNTFFMIQDNVPGAAGNMVAEINPLTGDTLQTFPIVSYFNVSYGDLEAGSNGNLFIVSSIEDSIAEFTPQGLFVQRHGLPAGVSQLSGIALDCSVSEAWVSNTSGTVFHLGQFPCQATGMQEIASPPFYLSEVTPNPFFTEANFSIVTKKSCRIKLTLLNTLGEEVKVIHDGMLEAGKKDFSFSGKSMSRGVFILKAEGNAFTDAKRFVYIQ